MGNIRNSFSQYVEVIYFCSNRFVNPGVQEFSFLIIYSEYYYFFDAFCFLFSCSVNFCFTWECFLRFHSSLLLCRSLFCHSFFILTIVLVYLSLIPHPCSSLIIFLLILNSKLSIALNFLPSLFSLQ